MPGIKVDSFKRASTLVTLLIFGLTSTVGGWLLQPPSIVHAEGLSVDPPQTFTVNSTADDALDTECSAAHCTLRGAITAANASTGDDTILFSIGDNQTITLNSMLPLIRDINSGTLTITGEPNSPTLNGDDKYRVFTVGNNAKITLTHMTFTNGNHTGGDCGLRSCGGGLKIEAGATATITDAVIQNSTASGSGGAIYNLGTANLTRVTLQGSSSDEGGGILNGGTLNIKSSLIKGNTSLYGGGILIVTGGVMTAENSTFSGNTAEGTASSGGGGAVDIYSGSASFTFCTITNNTAVSPNQAKSGLWLENGTLNIQNSIISGNNGANNFYRTGGTFTSSGYNLADAWNGLTAASSDLTGDPKLKVLADNGGSTFTHALQSDSPAIGAANQATCLSTDQRGFLRNSGLCDIGAYELLSAPTDISLSASTVFENKPGGSMVGTLSATDPDSGDPFTYALAAGTGSADNSSFVISGTTLYTSAPFNYETKSSYSIRVRTTDQSGLTFEEQFTVTVTDVNEAPTDISLSASTVAENLPGGATVGTLSNTDPDSGNTFTYSLVTGTGDADNGSFIIFDNSLITTVPFNYETKNSYSIRISAADQSGLTFEKQFTITVTNVNETPTGISLSAASVVENAAVNTVVGTLSTTDPDSGNTFTYTLASGIGDTDNASFTISGDSLQTLAAFDYETKSIYSILVRSTDQGGMSVEKQFTITVTNVNDAPTDISLSAGSVAENAAVNTVVGTLASTDPDSGDTFTYTLVTGTGDADNGSFNISGNSLRTSEAFDYETKSSYSILVRTADQGGLWVEKQFTITVTDSPADITLTNTHVTTAQSIVGTLATVGEGIPYTYSLQNSGSICNATNGADNSRFQVDGAALRRLATTLAGTYQICIQTEDAKLEDLQKSFTIDVTTSTVPPSTWTAELTSNKVIDGDPAGTLVGTVVSSVAGTTFELTDSAIFPLNSAFNLSSDGSLTLVVSANIHLQQNYPIRILATASDGSTLIIDALIRVMKNGEGAGAAAGDDHGEVVEGGVIEVDVLANDTMSSGAASWTTHEIIRYPNHGTARIGSIIYSPNSGYVGTDTITYRACDNLDFCVVGELTLVVRSIRASHTYIPHSGFSPNRVTLLPEKPAATVYSDTGDIEISIPDLGIQSSVVGIPLTTTGWDITWLGNQVGWLNGSAFPTLNGNSVLTGHVYTADGAPGIFIDISKLRWGDEVIVRVDDQSYVYEVRQVIDHVDPSDVETLMEHKDNPWITLVTCEEYDEETNTYQWRYIVRAVLTKIE